MDRKIELRQMIVSAFAALIPDIAPSKAYDVADEELGKGIKATSRLPDLCCQFI